MARDYATMAINQVRRSDRAMTDEVWIKDMLRRSAYASIAMVHEGQPFINTNLFMYDEHAHAIYFHTARLGRTRSNIDANGRVCFSISEIGRLLPADEALEFSVEYAGVTVFGQASVIEDAEAARDALQMLLDKYAPHLRPGVHYRPIQLDEIKRTAVYRIDIEAWSGKRKTVPDEFPGAYVWLAE
jgi:nitroimidazol reductase NimA-like FMN-containing flavoprotein (pyridoxamine 5'-phosphate oxidase superfamily)